MRACARAIWKWLGFFDVHIEISHTILLHYLCMGRADYDILRGDFRRPICDDDVCLYNMSGIYSKPFGHMSFIILRERRVLGAYER